MAGVPRPPCKGIAKDEPAGRPEENGRSFEFSPSEQVTPRM
jgi:hypothetical protein